MHTDSRDGRAVRIKQHENKQTTICSVIFLATGGRLLVASVLEPEHPHITHIVTGDESKHWEKVCFSILF
jgi:hypothetical protein